MLLLNAILAVIAVFTSNVSGSDEEKVYQPIRVLHRINLNTRFGQLNIQPLQVAVPPANFSGPAIFSHLVGLCFKFVDGNYQYEVCPFKNVTQQEVSLTSWNAYRGVIGTWKEWLIRDEKFHGWVMENGDSCSPGKRRRAHVVISCAENHKVFSVKEVVTCFYVINFTTPAACNPDSLLVYPILPVDLRKRWDFVWNLRQQNLLTVKGYTEELGKIFSDANLSSSKPAVDKDKVIQQLSNQLKSYKMEIRSLQIQNRRLKDLLQLATDRLRKLQNH